MGVVARQGFKGGIVTYLGIALGVLNNLLVYPILLEVEEYGVVQFVTMSASFFSPFLLLGFAKVIHRYFSVYQDEGQATKYLYSLVVTVIGLTSALFIALFFIFKERIVHHYTELSNVPEIAIYVLLGISIIIPFNIAFQKFASAHQRIALPSLFNQVYKLVLPLIILGYFLNVYSFEAVLIGILIYYVILFSVNRIYLNRLANYSFVNPIKKFLKDKNRNRILEFAGFSVLTGVAGSFANQIDVIMITGMKGTFDTGIYAWGFFVVSAISVPLVLMGQIASPLIAKYWKEEDHKEISSIYEKSSSTLLVICLGLFLALYLVLDDIFLLMPKGDMFMNAKYVILFLGLAKIIDVGAGVNSEIIAMSPKYKMVLYFIIASGILNVVLNLLLIPEHGIVGSAWATFASVLVFNLLKFIYLQFAYKLQPYSIKTVLILVLGTLLFVLISLIPKVGTVGVNIIVKAGLFVVVYALLAYKMKLAPEVNNFINNQLPRIGIKPFD